MISEQILEVRFKPNARVLDRRGHWAEIIAQDMGLKNWKIVENRVDISSADSKIRAFVSFKNFGLVILNAPTSNFFHDKAKKLIGVLSKLPDFDFPLGIQRCGIRSKICHELDIEVSEISSVIRNHFLIPKSLEPIGGAENVIDSAIATYFNTDKGQLNIRISSNPENEIKAAFSNHPTDTLPTKGWISDIDYFSTDFENLSQKALVRRITEFSDEIDRRYKAVSKMLKF